MYVTEVYDTFSGSLGNIFCKCISLILLTYSVGVTRLSKCKKDVLNKNQAASLIILLNMIALRYLLIS